MTSLSCHQLQDQVSFLGRTLLTSEVLFKEFYGETNFMGYFVALKI
jgi:hypothetical protein